MLLISYFELFSPQTPKHFEDGEVSIQLQDFWQYQSLFDDSSDMLVNDCDLNQDNFLKKKNRYDLFHHKKIIFLQI